MLYWALVFFIVSIIAAIFGFGGVASGAAASASTAMKEPAVAPRMTRRARVCGAPNLPHDFMNPPGLTD